eukprot:jgi/Chlat1/8827/Chrsp91S08164
MHGIYECEVYGPNNCTFHNAFSWYNKDYEVIAIDDGNHNKMAVRGRFLHIAVNVQPVDADNNANEVYNVF